LLIKALRSALDWRPPTPFYYGWLVLAMAALATFAATGFTQIVLGAIQNFIFDETGWNRSTIALAVSIGTWTSGLISPLVGRLADRHGPRWLMPAGLIAAGVCFFGLAGIHAVWHFYAAYIVGRAISNPVVIGVVPRTTAVNFFRRRRNLALAISSTFRPLGGAINIQIISAVAGRWGWRNAYRGLGIASFALILPLVAVMRRQPEDIGLLPDGAKAETGREAGAAIASNPGHSKGQPSPLSPEESWNAREAVRTNAFWLIGITAFLSLLGAATIGYSMVPFLVDQASISTAQAAGVFSLSTFLSVANVGWAYVADRFSPRRVLMVLLVATGATALYIPFIDSLASAYVFGMVYGLLTGTVGVLEQMMLAQYFGRGSYGTISGLMMPSQTVALGMGPVIGAVVKDTTGSYYALFIVMNLLNLVAAYLVFRARRPERPTASMMVS